MYVFVYVLIRTLFPSHTISLITFKQMEAHTHRHTPTVNKQVNHQELAVSTLVVAPPETGPTTSH